MTVVYIDELFLLNLVVNYLLLLASAKVAGEPLFRWRMGLGAAFGAGYAAAIVFPQMGFLLHPLCKCGAAIFMLLLAFGGQRRLLRLTLAFFGISAAFGGGIYALQMLGNRGLVVSHFGFSSALDLRLILLSAAACYCVLTLTFQRAARHSGGELIPCTLSISGKKVQLTALLDTGNTLTDPLDGRPVMVADGVCLKPFLAQDVDLRDPVSAMAALRDPKRFRLLPYRAVGVPCGMLLALRVDGVLMGKTDQGSMLVALSPTAVSDGGGYQALIGRLT